MQVNYKVILDESGQFMWKTKYSSVVAGLLIKGRTIKEFTEDYANNCLITVKNSQREAFKDIKINPYHGKDEQSVNNGLFVYEFMNFMSKKQDVSLLAFRNDDNNNFNDGNWTYLNVFADGIIKLAKSLLDSPTTTVKLDILYARRQNVHYFGDDRDDNGISTNENNQIETEEYIRRLKERLQIELMRLPSEINTKIKYSLISDSATSNKLLMLADIVCFGVCGGLDHFKTDIQEKIKKLPVKWFDVGQSYKWDNIQNYFTDGFVGNSICYWYSDDDSAKVNSLAKYKEEFEGKLLKFLKENNSSTIDNALSLVSGFINSHIIQYNLQYIDKVLSRIEDEMFLILDKVNTFNADKFKFDIYFHHLTLYTHTGNIPFAKKYIEKCDEISKRVIQTVDDISYKNRYELRKVEFYKDAFEPEIALSILDRQIKFRLEYQDLANMLIETESEEESKEFKKLIDPELGKLYGSYIQTVSIFYNNKKKLVAQAISYAKEAIKCFPEKETGNISRALQNECMINIVAGDTDTALRCLAAGLGLYVDQETNMLDYAENIVGKIIDAEAKNLFFMVHYAHILFEEKDEEKAKILYQALIKHGFEEWLKNCRQGYPVYVIYLYLGAYLGKMKNSKDKAVNFLNNAKNIAMKSKMSLPIYAAALSISARIYAITHKSKDLEELRVNMLEFNEIHCNPLINDVISSTLSNLNEENINLFIESVPIM